MLSRRSEAAANPVQTEEALGQRADEFSSIPEFAPWADRVKVLTDGKPLNLDGL